MCLGCRFPICSVLVFRREIILCYLCISALFSVLSTREREWGIRERDRQTDRDGDRAMQREGKTGTQTDRKEGKPCCTLNPNTCHARDGDRAMQREGKTGTQTDRDEGKPCCTLNPNTCHARAIPYDIYCGGLGSARIVYSLPSCAASQLDNVMHIKQDPMENSCGTQA